MELVAKYRGGKYGLFDGAGKPVGEVRKLCLKNGQLRVLDEKGDVRYTIVKNRDRIEVAGEMETESGRWNGRMIYEQDVDGKPLPTGYFRPPMAESLVLDTPWGEIKIVQDRKREFKIFLQGKQVGGMSHMMSIQKKITVLPEKLPKDAWGLMLGLGMCMLREDDVEIV